MDEERLKTLFPRASRSFLDVNAGLPAEQSKQDLRSPLVSGASGETEGDARIVLRYVMYRVRLLDPDNKVGATKKITDCLREIGLIPDDSEAHIKVEVDQVKVNHRNEQRTELHIKYP